ncbi:hypothetical protein DYBT9275_03624 [Dyadobacter sp. CECT 9275]|uniref:RNA polymerase sigma factor 70 region 4 type 2 domain-containing protein n=1 Tax=Dyadobacter helix TaxID=2822344 RepID=A0A916N6V7_9BACT|nr:sigma-70 family RNA polymerase sigma factor [Dyadobacter sp. CECT 9275]CAG5005659.1 hypothetical protein DYBT9275_03624 [Dyadobacter sp. CECT 9275]
MNQSTHSSETPDTELLWQRFLNSDVEAFELLMNSYFRDLFHYGSKFSKNQEFVKDSIQDLFLTLWERRSNLSTNIAVKAYLMASLRRMMHRSTLVQNRLHGESADATDEIFDVEFSVEQKYIESESTHLRSLRIRQSLEELPKRQKEVIYLKYFQEMDRTQISEIMGVSPQTVSNLLQIALGQLKKHFKVELLTLFLPYFFI